MASMIKRHGPGKGPKVFFATKNKGTISEADQKRKAMKARALKL